MKPESTFIKGVHGELHPDVYREKMHNPLRGGTPDVYYDGFASQLWVEYKWVKSFPKNVRPNLSGLQLAWLVRIHDRGKEPWVVVGSPTGCIVLRDPRAWKQGVARDGAQVLSKQELARRIETRCGLEPSGAQHSLPRTSTP